MSILLKDKFKNFTNNKISNNETINESLKYLIDDLNSLLKDTESINSQIERYLILFDLETIEQLKFKVNQLEKRYNSYANLYNKDNYSSVIKLDFNSESDRLPSSESNIETLYSDPKLSRLKYNPANYLFINGNVGGLQFPIEKDNILIPDKITLVHPINMGSYENFYYAKDNPDPVEFEIQIDFRNMVNVSYLMFTPTSFYPFNINGIYYFSAGTWNILPNTSLVGVFAKSEIDFGLIKTDKIKILVQLTSCKASNRSISYSNDEFTRQLLQEKNMFYTLEDYSTQSTEKFNVFAFHFGISDIQLGYRKKKNYGIFVSNNIKLIEPANFHLHSSEVNNNGTVSTEYYIRKNDYNKKQQLIGSAIIPMLPDGVEEVVDVLIPFNNVAKLNFFPNNNEFVVKRNGVVVLADKYTYDPDINSIKFNTGYSVNGVSGAVFTAEYTPLFINKVYPVPVIKPHQAIIKTIVVSPSDGELIDGNTKIKFISPYLFKKNTVTITKYINGKLDTAAPNLNIGLTVSGRIIIFNYDKTAYPKLTGSDFYITGELLDGSLIEEQPYYYTSDNSLIVNWESFKNYKDYSYSLINVIIIARRTIEVYTEDEFTINDVNLYSNNFNDLLLSVNNIKGII